MIEKTFCNPENIFMNDADKAYQAVEKQTKTLTTVKGKKKKSRDFHGTCKTGPKKRGGKKTPQGERRKR